MGIKVRNVVLESLEPRVPERLMLGGYKGHNALGGEERAEGLEDVLAGREKVFLGIHVIICLLVSKE